jgi:hypothetical protein
VKSIILPCPAYVRCRKLVMCLLIGVHRHTTGTPVQELVTYQYYKVAFSSRWRAVRITFTEQAGLSSNVHDLIIDVLAWNLDQHTNCPDWNASCFSPVPSRQCLKEALIAVFSILPITNTLPSSCNFLFQMITSVDTKAWVRVEYDHWAADSTANLNFMFEFPCIIS